MLTSDELVLTNQIDKMTLEQKKDKYATDEEYRNNKTK